MRRAGKRARAGKGKNGKGEIKGWEWEGNRLGKWKRRGITKRGPPLLGPLHGISYPALDTRTAILCIATRRNVLTVKVKVNVNLYSASSWTHLLGARHACSRDLTVLITSPIRFHGIRDSSSSSAGCTVRSLLCVGGLSDSVVLTWGRLCASVYGWWVSSSELTTINRQCANNATWLHIPHIVAIPPTTLMFHRATRPSAGPSTHSCGWH